MLLEFTQQTCGALLYARYWKRYLSLKKEREGGRKEEKEREAMCAERKRKERGDREGRKKEW